MGEWVGGWVDGLLYSLSLVTLYDRVKRGKTRQDKTRQGQAS